MMSCQSGRREEVDEASDTSDGGMGVSEIIEGIDREVKGEKIKQGKHGSLREWRVNGRKWKEKKLRKSGINNEYYKSGYSLDSS